MADEIEKPEIEDEVETPSQDDDSGSDDSSDDSDDSNDSGADREDDDIEGEGGSGDTRQPSVVDRKDNSKEFSAQIELARREAKEAQDRAIRIEQQYNQRNNNDAERLMLESMDPAQRFDYQQKKFQDEMKREMAITKFQNHDLIDRAQFQARAMTNKLYSKHEADVETFITNLRNAGGNVSREVALAQVIGQRMLKSYDSGAASKQRKQGEANIKKQKSSATSGKGNVHSIGGKKDSSSALRERLKGKSLIG